MSGEKSTHKGDVRSTRLNPQTDREYENYRDENELNDSEAVRRLIRRAIESENEDTLDKLKADDELRDRVDGAREEGETLDDAVRRLVREGAEVSTPAAEKLEIARTWAERFTIMFILFGLALSAPGGILSRSLPIVPITGEQVIAGAVLITLFFYFTNRVGAWRARRRENK